MNPPRAFRTLAFALWLLCLAPWSDARGAADPASGEGLPFMQNFTPRDYHANTQCWSAVQDARGVMYIGNQGLVLEYDGSSWRKLPVPTVGWVNRMAYDASTDTIYLGGEQLLGYLKTVPGGARTFVSLLDELPADERNLGGVRGVYATPDGVFFVGETRVMRWRDGRFKTWSFPGSGRPRSAWAGGSLYVQSSELGLRRLQGDEFVPASTDPLLNRVAMRGMVAGANGEILVATYGDGFFVLRDGQVRPWENPLATFFKDKGVYIVLPLRDGSLAVATNEAGLVILDRDGRFRLHADNVGGLHGNNILCLCEDTENGLWIGLQSGITRAEINSPLSILAGAPGDDLSGVVCGGQLIDTTVLGTLSGLYRVVGSDPATATSAHLARVPGVMEIFSSAVAVENGLLLAAVGKVVLLDKNLHVTPVYTTESNGEHLHHSRTDPGRGGGRRASAGRHVVDGPARPLAGRARRVAFLRRRTGPPANLPPPFPAGRTHADRRARDGVRAAVQR